MKTPIFKTHNGIRLTKALFLEQSYGDESCVLYTLSDSDHPKGYKSIYRLFMAMEDPTEFLFAEKYFDSYDHWLKIRESVWFKPLHERMARDLELKLKALSIQAIRQEAADPSNRSFYTANKYLAEKGYNTEVTKSVSKKDVKAKADALFDTLEDDASRIGISVN